MRGRMFHYHMQATVYDYREKRRRNVLSHLGSIGLSHDPRNSFFGMSDPYVTETEADLLQEALETIDQDRDRESTIGAIALASRATFAGVSPEVQP